mgnify:CR=1 FL=1
MSSNKLTVEEIKNLLNLGFYLRLKTWPQPNLHIRINSETQKVVSVDDGLPEVEVTDADLVKSTGEWEIYKIGTLDFKSAQSFLIHGFYIARAQWLQREDFSVCSSGKEPELFPFDTVADDWFVVLDRGGPRSELQRFSTAMVNLYSKAINVHLASLNIRMALKNNFLEGEMGSFAQYRVSTKDFPWTQTFNPSTATVDSILDDNQDHIAKLQASIGLCNFVNKLLKHMKANNISIEQLSQHLKSDVSYVTHKLHQPKNVGFSDLVLICKAIGYNDESWLK